MRAAARSRHPGGVNVAMCDGSVHFVLDEVDLATWRAASTVQGEEVYDSLLP
jgi:prepilin-type processing-associated H-X9-DG protein